MRIASWSKEYQGKVFLDRWTIIHLAFWLVVGGNFAAMSVPQVWRWPVILVGALLWEGFEVLLEKVRPTAVCTHETYINRWVSDPLMGIAGGVAGMYLIAPLVS